ncbi:hypothetical protein APSETT444_005252 [Aspergillus pseudonomiae]
MPQYRNGQSVIYKPVGGPDSRTPESIGALLTEAGNQASLNVHASEEKPRYENTGKMTTVYERKILGPAE